MNDASNEKPKIIVDEDWKSQVQAEKESSEPEPDAAGAADGSAEQESQLPPASFDLLLSTLASQAAMALGLVSPPDAKEIPVDLGLAKHCIDMLTVLEEKTKGNLTDSEEKMLNEVLHQLRMAFVGIQEHLNEEKPSIELP